MMNVLDQLAQGPVRVNATQCLRSRHRKSQCERCVAVCPVDGALNLEGQPRIDVTRCLGCGLCAAACPTGALVAQDPTDARLTRSLKETAAVQSWAVFACTQTIENDTRIASGAVLSVPCLGRLDASILLSGIADGLRTIWLVQGPCATCPKGRGGQSGEFAAAQVETTNRLLAAVGKPPAAQILADLPAEAAPEATTKAPPIGAVSRRDLFSLLLRETTRLGANVVEDAIDQVAPDPKEPTVRLGLPTALPERIARLRAALVRLSGADEQPNAVLEDGPWMQFGVAPSCNGCQLCAFFCPTGALSKIEREGRTGIAFRAAACTGCGLCAHVCLVKAATLARSVEIRKILEDTVEEWWTGEARSDRAEHATRDAILKQFRI